MSIASAQNSTGQEPNASPSSLNKGDTKSSGAQHMNPAAASTGSGADAAFSWAMLRRSASRARARCCFPFQARRARKRRQSRRNDQTLVEKRPADFYAGDSGTILVFLCTVWLHHWPSGGTDMESASQIGMSEPLCGGGQCGVWHVAAASARVKAWMDWLAEHLVHRCVPASGSRRILSHGPISLRGQQRWRQIYVAPL